MNKRDFCNTPWKQSVYRTTFPFFARHTTQHVYVSGGGCCAWGRIELFAVVEVTKKTYLLGIARAFIGGACYKILIGKGVLGVYPNRWVDSNQLF
mmetsp:Transcript_12400/g.12486  ORF Transcript_12400/g.12486 Transcript_12400/m.12486 type:complete len:95 (-) Transcript_12400:32-316(-)